MVLGAFVGWAITGLIGAALEHGWWHPLEDSAWVVAWTSGGAALLELGHAALGSDVWAVLVLGTVTSPWAIRKLPREHEPPGHVQPRRGGDGGCAGPVAAAPLCGVLGVLGALDDAELRRAWRATRRHLDPAVATNTALEMVAIRGAYLDELEYRHPATLASWLKAEHRGDVDSEWLLFGRTPPETPVTS